MWKKILESEGLSLVVFLALLFAIGYGAEESILDPMRRLWERK